MPSKQKKEQRVLSRSEKFREKVKRWASFYRANPHRFAKDYLGLNLFLYQQILLYMMDRNQFFMYFAARGQGKSFLIAVYCCIRAILYPNSKILIASGTKGQARLIITQKIEKELQNMSPRLRKEIRKIQSSSNECVVYFHNGSYIEAIVSGDNARGYRGNLLIVDEFRMVSKDNINKVLRPFLNVVRQAPFMTKPEYRGYAEENKEIYLSSAWYKNHWSWDNLQSYLKGMMRDKGYFVCGLPLGLNIEHGLITQTRVDQLKQEEDFDQIAFDMEYECLFFGESERAFYKLDDIQKGRRLTRAFYPKDNIDYLTHKKKSQVPRRKSGEIRILGVDVAMMGGDGNDNSIFTLARLLPSGDEYDIQIPYMESLNGQHSERQAVRLKQLYEDFECDYVVMDTMGNGISLYDACAKVNYDKERDVEYEAWTAFNDEEMSKRALTENALPVIFSMKVASSKVNHEVATRLRDAFQRGKIQLLVNDLEARDELALIQEYQKANSERKAKMILPYIQTTSLVNELVNLEYEVRSGYIKVFEVGTNRKDRYSSLAYTVYYAKQLEAKLKGKTQVNWGDYMMW